MTIYTRAGDKGYTSLYGAGHVPKDTLRIEVYGTIDELNSFIGLARASLRKAGSETPGLIELDPFLHKIQNELFAVGAHIATVDERLRTTLSPLTEETVIFLEKAIDRCTASLPPLKNFILPGGTRPAALLHMARTVCRRAERLCARLQREEEAVSIKSDEDFNGSGVHPACIRYLNRLSDALFTFARWVNIKSGEEDVLWKKEIQSRTSREL